MSFGPIQVWRLCKRQRKRSQWSLPWSATLLETASSRTQRVRVETPLVFRTLSLRSQKNGYVIARDRLGVTPRGRRLQSTRYDKLARNFLAEVQLAAITILLTEGRPRIKCEKVLISSVLPPRFPVIVYTWYTLGLGGGPAVIEYFAICFAFFTVLGLTLMH